MKGVDKALSKEEYRTRVKGAAMRYVSIPRTDLKPSVICMGGGPLCAENDEAGVFALLDMYYALGGNFIDSANIYGKWLPLGENTCDRNIGAWMRSRGIRDRLIVTSKGGHPHLETMSINRLSKSEVAADLDESLGALQCDTIDLYYLHRDDENVPVAVIVDYLNDFFRAGKVRYFGASNWRIERIEAAQKYAEQTGQQGFSANQVMWSYPVYDMSRSTIPDLVWLDAASRQVHRDSDLTVVAYQSQARGFFNKYAVKDEVPVPSALWAQYGTEENIQRYERAVRLAADMNVSLTAISLAYILNQPFPSIAIIGSHTEAQIQESMAAAKVELTLQQMQFLDGDAEQ